MLAKTARERVDAHFRLYYRCGIDDAVISDVRGSWTRKRPCPGGAECRHAFRGALGPCGGGTKLSLTYAEYGKRDSRGRFVRPYRAWEELRGRDA